MGSYSDEVVKFKTGLYQSRRVYCIAFPRGLRTGRSWIETGLVRSGLTVWHLLSCLVSMLSAGEIGTFRLGIQVCMSRRSPGTGWEGPVCRLWILVGRGCLRVCNGGNIADCRWPDIGTYPRVTRIGQNSPQPTRTSVVRQWNINQSSNGIR